MSLRGTAFLLPPRTGAGPLARSGDTGMKNERLNGCHGLSSVSAVPAILLVSKTSNAGARIPSVPGGQRGLPTQVGAFPKPRPRRSLAASGHRNGNGPNRGQVTRNARSADVRQGYAPQVALGETCPRAAKRTAPHSIHQSGQHWAWIGIPQAENLLRNACAGAA